MPLKVSLPGRLYTQESRFASTHWTIVMAAAQTQIADAHEALEQLCGCYWYPIYVFLRRRGYSQFDAEDLCQEFFARRVVTRLVLRGVKSGSGKFRTWLLNCLENFLCNEWDRQRAQKRGGGGMHDDFQEAESRYVLELQDPATPDKLYERAWARTLLDESRERLRLVYEEQGKAKIFEELKCFLPGVFTRTGAYNEAAVRLGKSEDAVKTDVKRLRQNFGRVLRAAIKRTVSSEAEAEEEIRYLLKILSS